MFGKTLEEEALFHENVAYGMLYVSIPTFLVLYYLIDAPWGKHTPKAGEQCYLGPLLNARWSWFIFEFQNILWTLMCFLQRDRANFTFVGQVLLLMIVIHYINRAFLHPLLMSSKSKPMPLAVVASAFVFCTFNG